VFNRKINKYLSSFSKPVAFVFAGSYTVPKLNINRWASLIVRDWQASAVLQYGSGLPLRVPNSNNVLASSLFRGTFASSTAFYNDYRQVRRYSESMGLSRSFDIREGMKFSVRAEFSNLFNRTFMNNPDSTTFTPVITRAGGDNNNPNAQLISGFGRINTGTVVSPARTGTIVARFTF
jgi:hypothetical protein